MDARLADYLAQLPRQPGHEGAQAPREVSEAVGPFGAQLRRLGLPAQCAVLLAAHAGETALIIVAWASIGAGALNGQIDSGWLLAWAGCLVSILPLRWLSQWCEGIVAIGICGSLRERLLVGALNVNVESIRRRGAGELLGEVLEIEQIERLGAAGGIAAVLAGVELLAAIFVLTWGAAPLLQVTALVAWGGIAALVLIRNARKRVGWTHCRLALTRRLVENMSAHQTRAVQQAASDRHEQEDRDHERYADLSAQLDRSSARINSGLARGYALIAIALLAPAFIGSGDGAERLGITLGGILLAAAALRKFAYAFSNAASACVAWQAMRPLFDAARAPSDDPAIAFSSPEGGRLMAKDIVFRHEGRHDAVLKSCSLTMQAGDFVLLEGASGSGKSTLAAVLAGLRRPHAGLILAGGLDPQTLGREWRRQVILAPQYHENHIFSAPLSFNLLLGRPLPHTEQDLAEARSIGEELGLGPLFERMPSGLDQMVGETGWQLSQGERSRVFLARALLQDTRVVVLDECLAALDAESLARCIDCIMRRANSALVIAHP